MRLAIETQLLGARTTVIESRHSMDRNNVVKLWTFVMEDLRGLGAKKLYPQFGNGSVNHISIRMLQVILLKLVLILGAAVRTGETFQTVVPPSEGRGWLAVTEVRGQDGVTVTRREEYDVIVSATGRRVPVWGFPRKSLDGKMAIAITANFVNINTSAERKVQEIPGLSKQYDLQFFKQMETKAGIRLENIVYYRDVTHYFVMTVKKDSLVRKGVIKVSCLHCLTKVFECEPFRAVTRPERTSSTRVILTRRSWRDWPWRPLSSPLSTSLPSCLSLSSLSGRTGMMSPSSTSPTST